MSFKRRNYISKKEFQAKFIVKFLALTLSTSLVIVAVFNFLARRKLEAMLYSFHVSATSTGGVVLPELIYTTGAVLLVVLVVTFVTLKRILMGISGPLFRIKKDLAKIEEGDLSLEIILRTKDEFKDVASDFNRMTQRLRDKFVLLGIRVDELSKAAIELDKYQDKPAIGLEKANLLFSKTRELAGELQYFRVKQEGKVQDP